MSRWKAPTRRSFFAMLGAGAAAIALREVVAVEREPVPEPVAAAPKKLLWIGHC